LIEVIIGALGYGIVTPKVGEKFSEGKPYFKDPPRFWVDVEEEIGE